MGVSEGKSRRIDGLDGRLHSDNVSNKGDEPSETHGRRDDESEEEGDNLGVNRRMDSVRGCYGRRIVVHRENIVNGVNSINQQYPEKIP